MGNQLTFSLVEPLASPSPSQDCGKDLPILEETSCWSFLESLTGSAPAGWSGKTSPAFCRRGEDGILAPSSGRWRNSGMGGPTESLTLNTSEFPSGAGACSLSDVLETGEVPQRFFLSPKACAGILRRAAKRGKTLPPMLHRALERVAGGFPEQRGQGPVIAMAFGGNNQSGPIDVATAINASGTASGRQDFELETFVAHSLRAEGFDASEDGTGMGTPLVPMGFYPTNRQPDFGNYEGVSPPVKCGSSGKAGNPPGVVTSLQVRRLTPVECERLQGFPDGYTDIRFGGKSTPDGPRYKALGNSMAVPVMRWIGERINGVARRCSKNSGASCAGSKKGEN